MDAPIFLPAIAGMLKTQRPVFSVTCGRDIDGEPQFMKVGFHVPCSALAQHEVVSGCAELVATPFQDEMGYPALPKLFRIGLQGPHGLHPERVLIEVE